MSDVSPVSVADTGVCSECGQDLIDSKQIFKNIKCCHYLCQTCSFFQLTVCNQCRRKQLFLLNNLNFEDIRLESNTCVIEKNENSSMDQIFSLSNTTGGREGMKVGFSYLYTILYLYYKNIILIFIQLARKLCSRNCNTL